MLGNDGRNYVLKRILRRAERYGRQYLGATKPFLCDLVLAVVESMGNFFPELKKNPRKISKAIEEEEKQFIRTLDRGIVYFNEAMLVAQIPPGGWGQSPSKVFPGADVFKLHDTYGLYVDIVEQMASEKGWTIDRGWLRIGDGESEGEIA